MNFKQAQEEHRWARFRIGWDNLISYPDEIHALLNKTLILCARFIPSCRVIEYEAISPLFDSENPNHEAPMIGVRKVPNIFDGSHSYEFCGEEYGQSFSA